MQLFIPSCNLCNTFVSVYDPRIAARKPKQKYMIERNLVLFAQDKVYYQVHYRRLHPHRLLCRFLNQEFGGIDSENHQACRGG